MGGFLKLIIRYHFFLLFVLLESLALYLVISNNYEKRFKYISSANAVSGYLYDNYSGFLNYINLREQNIEISKKNNELLNQLAFRIKSDSIRKDTLIQDTVKQYYYYDARVINNSVNKKYNYMTLNKGINDGIEEDMGVISAKGVVGIVRDVTNNYASVISVLNGKLGISAKLKKNDYFGSLVWNGLDPQTSQLYEIPSHVELEKGDTVVTSSYSSVFPEGIMIGVISDFHRKSEGNFYDISVTLSADLSALTHVYLIKNVLRQEQLQIEQSVNND